MIKIFKHTFIPHEQNDYKPHFFREKSVAIILAVSIFLLAISFGANYYIKSKNLISTVLPAVLVDLTNEARQDDGKLALEKNILLENAASLKAEDMATYSYFAHTSPMGITPWHWFSQVGYSFVYAGENLAVDFNESTDVERAWLRSPTHKANILNNKFTEIGIAVKEGYFEGHPTIYVVQMFGTPAFSQVTKEEVEINKVAIVEPIVNTKDKLVVENNEIKPIDDNVVAQVATAPKVMGEQVVLDDSLETIDESPTFISVKNTAVAEEPVQPIAEENVKYASSFQKFLFKIPGYTERFYEIFVWVILVALLLMMFIEIRRQHPKNILFGILIIVIIFTFIYLNRSMIITSLFA